MAKEIWLGPVLGSNRERLLARCAEYVSQGETDRLLYIAASHPLLDIAAARVLDGKITRGVWGEFPFYLFRGFVRRVLSSAVVSEARHRGPQPGGPAGVGASARASISEPLLTRGLPTQPLHPRVPIDREELPLRRSLISQIIRQLADAERLEAIRPLANRDGCVNTIASTIGELQRAGITPDEFRAAVEARAGESQTSTVKSNTAPRHSQIDFDREVALVYSKYSEALDRFGLTDDDADQLRALQILRGELNGEDVSLPWLNQIDLLVLDGFFDFTPVQGQMLRQLIPTVPNVIVNVNHDQRNEQIFRPFQSTIEQLQAFANFEERRSDDIVGVNSQLMALREKLFNPSELVGTSPTIGEGSAAGKMPAVRPKPTPADRKTSAGDPGDAGAPHAGAPVTLLECSDRETEIRSIVKEVKRLIVEEGHPLSEIALVVRERAAYADTILRVCAAESMPCNLERRIEANQIPCVRACAKLFQILKDRTREHVINPKAAELAHLLKTDYFRVSHEDLQALSERFDEQYALVFDLDSADGKNSKLRYALGIGHWAPDMIENVIAYVGSELRVRSWLNRAQNLINVLPSPEAARSFIGDGENAEGDDAAAIAEQEPPPEDAPQEKTKRPAPVHPATIAWTMLVMDHLRQTIALAPEEGSPDELRAAIMLLLERLEFSKQVSQPLGQTPYSMDIPQATIDVRGMESLRRALAATVRSFQMSESVVAENSNEPALSLGLPPRVSLSSFVDELKRCVQSQVLSISTGDRDGLRVLEATDVRGLRFRAMFIAGMVEGGFPLRASRDWLYPHEERERLKKYGVVLEDISTDTLLKEEHYFYQCACRTTERLYLTRPLATDDGNETVPSYYIEELRRAISPAQLEKKQIRSEVDDQDFKLTSTVTELGVELIRQKARQSHRSRIEDLLPASVAAELLSQAHREGYVSDSVLRRVEIEMQRAGDSFGPYDGRITNRDLQTILETHFGNEHVYSASGLSAYGNCPFRFFAARVLKLEPRNEAALDLPAIDAGKLLHDVLRRFFERHRKEYLPALDREKLRKEIVDVADKVFREHELLVPPLNERIWKIDCEIRKLILEQVLLFELRLQERTCARGMQPTYFELAFGRASQASDPSSSGRYLKLERSDTGSSEAALIQGQIDRVDVSKSGKRAIAYDYKLSQGAKLNDMESGRQVQIPIYLAALEQLFVPGFELAGGGYYRLRGRGARLNQGLYRKVFEDCTEVSNHRVKLDEVEWQRIRRAVSRRVWQFIDGMRGGDFRVLPSLGKVTCKFCDFSAVCRYDTYRIGRKKLIH